ncbi:MAG: ABC transporter permease [Flavobacterium sp.]|nr:ABC transporter permease [Flavobacterium sp.]
MAIFKTALRFIKYDKAKSIGVTSGILISTFLIGQQLGILDYLMRLMAAPIDNAKAQIWVADSRTIDANQLATIDIKKLREVCSVSGVKEAFPLVVSVASATVDKGRTSSITLIGIESPHFNGGPPSDKIINGKLENLQMDGAVCADFFDEKVFEVPIEIGTQMEINGKKAIVAVQTKGVRGFGFGFMYTTLERARYFSNLSTNKVNAILVNVNDGADIDAIVNNINATVYSVKAYKTKDLRSSTISTVIGTTGIASSTGTLIIFALIAGFFIIGLTMYSSALDRIKDYGTLKAIGASNNYIRKLILIQAVLFAVIGYILAYILLLGFKAGVAGTGLLVHYRPDVLVGIFVVIVSISVIAATFALRRIKGVEPASVFRG